MKINILSISNNELVALNKNYTIPLITSNLYKNGFDLVGNNLVSSNYENILKNIEFYYFKGLFSSLIILSKLYMYYA